MIKQETITETFTDAEGNITEKTTSKETLINPDREPDYIKIYTKMFCDFKGVPEKYTRLFLELAMRMTYCNSTDLPHSQLVSTGGPFQEDIMKICGWKTKDPYLKGLKALCECGAIKKVKRGFYQINPEYAGRGSWKFNPRDNQGGIKDLVTTFHFKENYCDTSIVWADDGSDNKLNETYRNGLKVSKRDETQLKHYWGEVDEAERKAN